MAKGFVQGALREYTQGNAARYNELIGQFTRKHNLPNAPSTEQLYIWIMTLSECVSQLDKGCHELVTAVLQVDWSVRSDTFVNNYIRFVKNLVSAHSFYVVPALNAIIGGFRYRIKLPPYNTTTRSTTYIRHHEALQEIMALIPTASNSLYICIQRHLPFKQKSTAHQAAYVKNIIDIMNYVPVLRKQIMTLLVDHLVKIDSHIQIELDDLEEDVEFDTYNMNFDEDYASDASSDEDDDSSDSEDDIDKVGNSDIDSDFGDSDDDEQQKQPQSKQMRQVRSMVRRLDSMMQLIFNHFNTPTKEFRTDEMYAILLDSFDRTVLKTIRSRYTQFLLFYFCSLDSQYASHFLDHLFQHVTDPLRPNVTRIAAAAYISSYVARAKFMPPEAIQHAMAKLCHYCEDLVDQYEAIHLTSITTTNETTPSVDRNEVFYASMQAIMYIFCFRWRDLVLPDADDDDDDLVMEGVNDNKPPQQPLSPLLENNKKWSRGLRNIPRLLTTRLYPLKVCSTPVVRQFVKIAHHANFMYLYPLLEKNKDMLLSGVNVNATSATGARHLLHTVQTFFPFDPYKLEGSKKFIDGIYFEWIPEDADDSDSDSDHDSSDQEEDDDDDSDAMSAGMTAMSISPSPNSFL
ncbi:unnamed protein product [Absidia cylindrospora]